MVEAMSPSDTPPCLLCYGTAGNPCRCAARVAEEHCRALSKRITQRATSIRVGNRELGPGMVSYAPRLTPAEVEGLLASGVNPIPYTARLDPTPRTHDEAWQAAAEAEIEAAIRREDARLAQEYAERIPRESASWQPPSAIEPITFESVRSAKAALDAHIGDDPHMPATTNPHTWSAMKARAREEVRREVLADVERRLAVACLIATPREERARIARALLEEAGARAVATRPDCPFCGIRWRTSDGCCAGCGLTPEHLEPIR